MLQPFTFTHRSSKCAWMFSSNQFGEAGSVPLPTAEFDGILNVLSVLCDDVLTSQQMNANKNLYKPHTITHTHFQPQPRLIIRHVRGQTTLNNDKFCSTTKEITGRCTLFFLFFNTTYNSVCIYRFCTSSKF